MEYFCIFSGGGVRGTAYVGALEVLEKLGVNITGTAGSSVGSIFAAFHSVGYSSQEIYNKVQDLSYESFKDLYLPLKRSFGLYKGDNIYHWVKNLLEEKFYGPNYIPGRNEPITFKDIEKDLIVIAIDISSGQFRLFSKYTTPNTEVANAIRASISIPGFYQPVWEGNKCLVDGDIIKNLPLWRIANELIPKDSKILEFRLEGCVFSREIKGPMDYLNAVIDTSTNISTDFIIDIYGKNDRFDFIKIDTGNTSVIDFSINEQKKQDLIEKGSQAVIEYFVQKLPEKKNIIRKAYISMLETLEKTKRKINKGLLKDAQISVGNFSIILLENKEYINTEVFDKSMSFVECFKENLKVSLLLRKLSLKNKNVVEQTLNEILIKLEQELSYIDLSLKSLEELKTKSEDILKTQPKH